MTGTVLVRIRFPRSMVAMLDRNAGAVSERLGRRVFRAAVVRAIVHMLGDKMSLVDTPGLAGLFALDTVRRGRARQKRAA